MWKVTLVPGVGVRDCQTLRTGSHGEWLQGLTQASAPCWRVTPIPTTPAARFSSGVGRSWHPAVPGRHPCPETGVAAQPQVNLQLRRGVHNPNVESVVTLPRDRTPGRQIQQPMDPLDVRLTAAAPGLLVRGRLLDLEAQAGERLDLVDAAQLTGAHHLVFVEEENRHPGSGDELIELPSVTPRFALV